MNKYIYFIFILFFTISNLSAQGIHGKLIDSQTQKVISGATIFYQGQYTISDDAGEFGLLKTEKKPVKILVTHLGYEPYEASLSIERIGA